MKNCLTKQNGKITNFQVSPSDAGIPIANPEDLKGGDAKDNAEAMMAMLEGKLSAFRNIVIYTAGAALIVADKAQNLKDGAEIAANAIDGGHAKRALEKLIIITNE